MIEIDGVELRTAAQWEKKHRHVKKGQLGKGVERTWRSPNGNTTAMFYNIEQTRPWAKKDVEAVNRRRRADAKAKREAEARWRLTRYGGNSAWYYCHAWDVRYDPDRAKELLETGPREYDRLPDGRPYDGRPWWRT